MNNIFDFRRFVQVFRLSWQNQPILPYVVLLGMIPLLLFFFVIDAFGAYINLQSNGPFLMFNEYLFICGWLDAGVAYSELGKPGSATRYLMLPASALEKWLAKSLLVWIIFPVITWLTFNLVFEFFGWISLRWFAFKYRPINWVSADLGISLFIFYMALPAAYASGVAWKRLGILKGLVFFVVLFIVLIQLILIGTGGFSFVNGKSSLIEQVSLSYYNDDIDADIQIMVRYFWLIGILIPSFLLFISSYFFTRERTL